jgi:pimeloyl-ACP methyl ester carboxylesterase
MKKLFLSFAIALSLLTPAQESNQAIHVEVTGTGQPILLIPGFSVPGNSWDATVKQLEQNYQCHTVTLAGFGGEDPIDFPWLPSVNQAIEKYINNHELNNLTIIGHSLGGTIATWLASRGNDHISQLILIDALPAAGALMIPNFNPDTLAYDSPYNNQQLAMSDNEFNNMAQTMAQAMSLDTETQNKIKDWMILADRKTYVYGYTDYLKLDLRKDLRNIRIPVTIIAADKPYGREMVSQTYQNQYANLENYELLIADNAAHFVMFDQPLWFMEQIQQILASDK